MHRIWYPQQGYVEMAHDPMPTTLEASESEVVPEYVDATKLNDFLQCIRYGYWRHERHLVPVEPGLSLIYGGAIHAALAAHYRSGDMTDMIKAFDKEWERAMGREDAKRNPQQGLRTLIQYLDTYPQEHFKVLGVEMPGLIPLAPHFVWTMIIDLLVEGGGGIFPIDHKTSSSFNDAFWAGMNPNHQFTGYMNGVRAVSGYKVNMLMVNGILVTKSPTIQFQRQITNRHPRELERWQNEILTFWQDTVLMSRQNGIWPRNPDRCQRWWGGCQYHTLCTTVSEDYMTTDPSPELYRIEVWDPLERIKEVQAHG